MKTSGLSAKTLLGIGFMCGVIILTGWMVVPSLVPFTMQTLGVFLAVGLLGTKSSMLAVTLYLALGTLGLPVFAGMKGGAGVLLGPTGGYLMGFLLTAFVAGLCWGNTTKAWRMALALGAGLLASYAAGTLWYVYGYTRQAGLAGWTSALMLCVVPYILPDTVKIVLAVTVTKTMQPVLSRMGWKRW